MMPRSTRLLLMLLPCLVVGWSVSYAQVPGVPAPTTTPGTGGDSLIVFKPVRPLIDSNALRTSWPQAIGLNLFFSNSGYGGGLYFQRKFGESLSGTIDLAISGARNGDELQEFNIDPNSVHFNSYFVPNKVNRVWHAPITVGVKQELFANTFFDNFRPFINLGLGGTVVLTTPYDHTFFDAFGHAEWRLAPGGYLGVGAEFTEKSPGISFNIRYYYLPIDPGVESVRNEPITNLGGLFLNIGVPF